MKPILAVFTLLLFGSVSSATTITEPATFTITAHSTSGSPRTITFKFSSAPPVVLPDSDQITITHSGSGSFCLPAGTTTIPESPAENPFTFTCAGFKFVSPLTSVDFLEPGGVLGDTVTLFNSATGSGGFFVSASTVAEPAGLAVLGSGLLILGGLLRRRARKGTPPARE